MKFPKFQEFRKKKCSLGKFSNLFIVQIVIILLSLSSAAFENRLAVAIVRVRGGLDFGSLAIEEAPTTGHTATSAGSGELRVRSESHIMHADSDLDIRPSEAQPSSRHNLTS